MMTLLLLLCAGCGKKADQALEQAEQFRSVLQGSDFSFQCSLNIDYGDRVYDFSLAYAHEAGGEDTLTVLQPESISGLSIAIDGDSLQMLFNDTRLETGALSGGISAVTALPMMLSAWSNGVIEYVGTDTLDGIDCYVIEFKTYSGEQETTWQLWLDQAASTPLYGEISIDNTATVRCRFSGFTLQ